MLTTTIVNTIKTTTNVYATNTTSTTCILSRIIIVKGHSRRHSILPNGFICAGSRADFLTKGSAVSIPFSRVRFARGSVSAFAKPSGPVSTLLTGSPSIHRSKSVLRNSFFFHKFHAGKAGFCIGGIPNIFARFGAPLCPVRSLRLVSKPGMKVCNANIRCRAAGPNNVIDMGSGITPSGNIFSCARAVSNHKLFNRCLS